MKEAEQYLQVGDMELRAKDIKTLLEEHDNMKQEIERLNNIINELEQWLEEAIETIGHISLDGASGLDMALKKIKELKGSEKE